ncbi:MAG: hypothetical protein N3B16_06040, partial [Candidatus Aminicenantes bacterium]|nr:hypothetical protein [Candidatus Aminicenantes bacterium]
ISAGAIEERLINEIEATISIKKESGVLYHKIENLQKEAIIPAEIASYLHTIRIFANKARHGGEKIIFTRRDIYNILGILLRVIEWFYCEFDKGPRYSTIYTEVPEVPKIIGRTILPSASIYLFLNPIGGLLFSLFKINKESVFLAFILFILALSFIDQFKRTKRFLGLRVESEAGTRFRSYGALLLISLLVILNSPLLVTSYTGIDPYGTFLFFPKNSKLWAIVIDMAFNFFLASLSTTLFFWIIIEWAKRKPQDVISSTFTTVCIPLAVVYVIATLLSSRGTESFLLIAFFPLLAGLLAIVGYSHPNNKLDLFTSKLLFVLSIIFMVIGFILAMGGLIYKLYEFSKITPINFFESLLWKRSFRWQALGMTPEEYIEKLKMGFTWMVLTVSIYLELAIGFNVAITIYQYQYIPASKDIRKSNKKGLKT